LVYIIENARFKKQKARIVMTAFFQNLPNPSLSTHANLRRYMVCDYTNSVAEPII